MRRVYSALLLHVLILDPRVPPIITTPQPMQSGICEISTSTISTVEKASLQPLSPRYRILFLVNSFQCVRLCSRALNNTPFLLHVVDAKFANNGFLQLGRLNFFVCSKIVQFCDMGWISRQIQGFATKNSPYLVTTHIALCFQCVK